MEEAAQPDAQGLGRGRDQACCAQSQSRPGWHPAGRAGAAQSAQCPGPHSQEWMAPDLSVQEASGHTARPVDSSSPKQVLTHLSSRWAQSCGTDTAGTRSRSSNSREAGCSPCWGSAPRAPAVLGRLSQAQEDLTLEHSGTATWSLHMWPLRSPLGVWSAHRAHPVLQVGEVRVPAQRQAVDVGDSELRGHEEEVHQLGCRPNAPVGLRGGEGVW